MGGPCKPSFGLRGGHFQAAKNVFRERSGAEDSAVLPPPLTPGGTMEYATDRDVRTKA
jgi:hypothetical protein